MKKFLNACINKFFAFFFREKKSEQENSLDTISSLPHSCALCALYQVIPNLTPEDLEDAFKLCTDSAWPNRGITNKEFNITLKYLGIFDRFSYSDKETTIFEILNLKSSVIVLIHGHYTVIQKGMVKDKYGYFPKNDEKVYCYWSLSS